MPTTINREQVERLMCAETATLVEVPPREAYDNWQLPGAINLPLEAEDFEARAREALPDRHQPVVVYCSDSDRDASPTAARRLEEMGYEQVYDYEAGKQDWREADKPIER